MSKQQASVDVLEGNILIANFMGWVKNKTHGWLPPGVEDSWFYEGDDGLKYHSSWDWIVPVVQKIILINFPNTPENNSALYPVFKAWELISLHQIWESVVQFIQWHNTQTKKK